MREFWQKIGSFDSDTEETANYQSILDIVESSTAKFKDRIAFSNIGCDMTYTELDKGSRDFAAYLQNLRGLKRGDRVALMMPNILQFPVACLGIIRAGMIVVNTNPLYTEREMKHQFTDAGAKALIIFSGMAKKAQAILADTEIEHVVVTNLADLHPWAKRTFLNFMIKRVARMVPSFHIKGAKSFRQALEKGSNLPYTRPSVSRGDLAMLQYTGGTTGVSKGAMLTHGNLISNLEQTLGRMTPMLKYDPEVVITPLPLYHIYSFTCNFLGLMHAGHHSVLITNPRNVKTFVASMKRYKFTSITGVNTLFVSLCESEAFKKLDFSHLHITSAGGMALTQDAADTWKKITGCDIYEGYGLTEASPVLSVNTRTHRRAGTIGRPVANTEIKIIDDDGKDLPLGDESVRGELCARGPQVMIGYWQQEEETKNTLTSDGWLKTGDIATISADGFIKIVDRKKDMIIVSGFNVYPNEVEDAVVRHPGILECAAIGIPNKKTGETVKLFVVRKDATLDKNDIIDFCRDNLTGYKVPKQIEFRDELPKTPVGKILRKDLRDTSTVN
jgi:long-chain acyl-CoA synthetase